MGWRSPGEPFRPGLGAHAVARAVAARGNASSAGSIEPLRHPSGEHGNHHGFAGATQAALAFKALHSS
jgi:hypothetical protein